MFSLLRVMFSLLPTIESPMAGGEAHCKSLIHRVPHSKPSGQERVVQLGLGGKEHCRGKALSDRYCLIESIAWQVGVEPTTMQVREEGSYWNCLGENTMA